MILKIRVNNFLVYSEKAEISMISDNRIKNFKSNIQFVNDNLGALKASCIYGGNNVGKTCMLSAIQSIKNVLLSIVANVSVNLFSGSNVCSMGATFTNQDKVYSYDFSFDLTKKVPLYSRGFIYEKFSEINYDKYGNESEKKLFVRDMDNDEYIFSENKELQNILKSVSSSNILIYTINSEKYPIVEEYRNILRTFASNIDIIDMNNIPMGKTINILKGNSEIKNKVVELIKSADIDIDDFMLDKKGYNDVDENFKKPQENVFLTSDLIDDMYRMTSVHRGKPVQSILFDSTGTKKMVALAGYIVESLVYGKTLIVDELDSSLHFKLTRAIVALFNNELNKNAQIIFATHDITLLDCKKLFRKDQIYFAIRDNDNVKLRSLKSFTASNDNIRSESDLIEKYKKGAMGTIPEPDLINILIGEDNE